MLLALPVLMAKLCIPMLMVGLATSLNAATRYWVFRRVFRPGLLFAPLIALVAIAGSALLASADLAEWARVVAGLPLLFWGLATAWLQHRTRFLVAREHQYRGRGFLLQRSDSSQEE
ncbi:MAG: hypothetical protein KDI71_19645 [Xanthomonadales bacterium]|nr:hypothetical protein [Xanthomonadales bacterium]